MFHFSFLQIKVHETFLKSFENLKAGVLGRPEFTINGILVRVDNEILKQKIIKVINIQVPVSSLTLNLEDTRRKIEKLAGIKNATVSVDNYGKLIVTVNERLPAIINKVGSKYFLLDKDLDTDLINVGSGVEVDIRTLSEKIKNITEYQGEIVFDKTKPDGNPRKLLDSSFINSLGWSSRTSLDEGLSKTFKWFSKNIT